MLQKLIVIGQMLLANWDVFFLAVGTALASLGGACVAVAFVFTFIPGPQPEGWFYKAGAFFNRLGDAVKTLSRKRAPKDEPKPEENKSA